MWRLIMWQKFGHVTYLPNIAKLVKICNIIYSFLLKICRRKIEPFDREGNRNIIFLFGNFDVVSNKYIKIVNFILLKTDHLQFFYFLWKLFFLWSFLLPNIKKIFLFSEPNYDQITSTLYILNILTANNVYKCSICLFDMNDFSINIFYFQVLHNQKIKLCLLTLVAFPIIFTIN